MGAKCCAVRIAHNRRSVFVAFPSMVRGGCGAVCMLSSITTQARLCLLRTASLTHPLVVLWRRWSVSRIEKAHHQSYLDGHSTRFRNSWTEVNWTGAAFWRPHDISLGKDHNFQRSLAISNGREKLGGRYFCYITLKEIVFSWKTLFNWVVSNTLCPCFYIGFNSSNDWSDRFFVTPWIGFFLTYWFSQFYVF